MRAAACAALFGALALGWTMSPPAAASPPQVNWPKVFLGEHGGSNDDMLELRRLRPVPDFTLSDQHGRPLTQAQMQGKWTLLFFGYTHCPDYCPTTLSALKGALHRLEQENPKLDGRIQVLFVSVDPFRDTPAVMAKYIAYYGPRFIGATGRPQELRRLTKLMGINYDYTDASNGASLGNTLHAPSGNYSVDHTADFYVFDDHARLLTWVQPPHTVRRVSTELKRILQHYGGW